MENEVVLATTRGIPSSVAVEPVSSGRFAAAWSVDNSTWIAELDAAGAAVGPALRIEKDWGESPLQSIPTAKTFWPDEERSSIDSEHLVIVSLGNGLRALVMLERPEDGRLGGAYAAILSSSKKQRPEILLLGPAGEYANRIAAEKSADDLIVAWHKGMLDSSEALLARVELKPVRLKEVVRVSSTNAVSSPSLAAVDGRILLAWSETTQLKSGTSSLIRAAPLAPHLKLGARSTVAKGRFLDPSPVLTRVNDQIGIVFRDDADEDGTPEFYFSMVDLKGAVTLPPKRISQADGWRGPNLIYTAPHLISATIRSFQRNLLIGVNRFDREGVKLGGEFQVYADKTDFVRVDLAASGENILMIYAEDRRGSGRVLAGQVKCSAIR
ncbi:MAG: hypothetical protein GY847_40830 [Proteobacteria bacterium]|nr:hypothetical protein [Pseudomonadota bacterium]